MPEKRKSLGRVTRFQQMELQSRKGYLRWIRINQMESGHLRHRAKAAAVQPPEATIKTETLPPSCSTIHWSSSESSRTCAKATGRVAVSITHGSGDS